MSILQILPHKAWAAGDQISVVLKFTPLAKGVRVINVRMTLQEKVKTIWKMLEYEEIRVVTSAKQNVRRGRIIRQPSPPPLVVSDAIGTSLQRRPRSSSSFFRRVVQPRENFRGIFRPSTSRPNTPPEVDQDISGPSSPVSPGAGSSSEIDSAEEPEDIETIMKLRIPIVATPTHGLAPVMVSHRIKWFVTLVLVLGLADYHSYSGMFCWQIWMAIIASFAALFRFIS